MADQGAEGLLSPFLRKKRIRAAGPYLRGQVLDYGCGSGMLAAYVEPGRYFGVDTDPAMIDLARSTFPRHTFSVEELPQGRRFDTIVALAVIEHVPDPAAFLTRAIAHLAPRGSIVLTTPHPDFHFVHELGARLGFFSRAASEEHQELLDGRAMRRLAIDCGLNITGYRRFLFGANQLFLLQAPTGAKNQGRQSGVASASGW